MEKVDNFEFGKKLFWNFTTGQWEESEPEDQKEVLRTIKVVAIDRENRTITFGAG